MFPISFIFNVPEPARDDFGGAALFFEAGPALNQMA
jgi:hypothetical protein